MLTFFIVTMAKPNPSELHTKKTIEPFLFLICDYNSGVARAFEP